MCLGEYHTRTTKYEADEITAGIITEGTGAPASSYRVSVARLIDFVWLSLILIGTLSFIFFFLFVKNDILIKVNFLTFLDVFADNILEISAVYDYNYYT